MLVFAAVEGVHSVKRQPARDWQKRLTTETSRISSSNIIMWLKSKTTLWSWELEMAQNFEDFVEYFFLLSILISVSHSCPPGYSGTPCQGKLWNSYTLDPYQICRYICYLVCQKNNYFAESQHPGSYSCRHYEDVILNIIVRQKIRTLCRNHSEKSWLIV